MFVNRYGRRDSRFPINLPHLFSCSSLIIRQQIAISIMIAWCIAHICTITDLFPKDPSLYGHQARTDVIPLAIDEASWVRIPYPGMTMSVTINVLYFIQCRYYIFIFFIPRKFLLV